MKQPKLQFEPIFITSSQCSSKLAQPYPPPRHPINQSPPMHLHPLSHMRKPVQKTNRKLIHSLLSERVPTTPSPPTPPPPLLPPASSLATRISKKDNTRPPHLRHAPRPTPPRATRRTCPRSLLPHGPQDVAAGAASPSCARRRFSACFSASLARDPPGAYPSTLPSTCVLPVNKPPSPSPPPLPSAPCTACVALDSNIPAWTSSILAPSSAVVVSAWLEGTAGCECAELDA